MTDPIDYSRPVGWWCPVCCTADSYVGRLIRRKPRERKQKHYCLDDEGNRLRKTPIASCIPRYLPIPEGQRPLVEDEVEDAEVVTVSNGRGSWAIWSTGHDGEFPHDADWRDDQDVINRIAQASARARIVTGATK